MNIAKMFALYEELKDKDPADIVKKYIDKLFVHEAKKYQCEPSDLNVIINRETDGSIGLMIYHRPDNKVLRIIPDKEVIEILIK